MRIYSVTVCDSELGDVVVVCYTGRASADTLACKLRKTFRYVKIDPLVLHVGYNAPTELKKLAGVRR